MFRTLTVAKAVIKENKSVCNKEDKIIDLSEQQKLQEVSLFAYDLNSSFALFCLFHSV